MVDVVSELARDRNVSDGLIARLDVHCCLVSWAQLDPAAPGVDLLAQKIELPELSRGDLLAIGSSGAYGISASPTRFISHPEAREILVVGQGADIELIDVTQLHISTDANQLDASSLISSPGGQT